MDVPSAGINLRCDTRLGTDVKITAEKHTLYFQHLWQWSQRRRLRMWLVDVIDLRSRVKATYL